MGNLFTTTSGLEHLYLNGIPIVEASFTIKEVFGYVRRISGLAVNTDPYFANFPLEVKQMMQLHGDSDRITKEFLKKGAEEILPSMQSRQKLIPEGVYGGTYEDYNLAGIVSDHTWKQSIRTLVVKEVNLSWSSGRGFVTVVANGTELGTFELNSESISGQEGLRGANQDVDEIELLCFDSGEYYVPSIEELAEIQASLYDLGYGNLTDNDYWSSTETYEFAENWNFLNSEASTEEKTNESHVRFAVQVLNKGYAIGELITVEGENLWVWKVENGIAYCIKENDEPISYMWSNGSANISVLGATSIDGKENTNLVYGLGFNGGALGSAVEDRDEFSYDLNIPTIEEEGLSWRQALTQLGDVKFSLLPDTMTIRNFVIPYSWNNPNGTKVYESTIRCVSGSADVLVSVNGTVMGTPASLVEGGERNDDLRGSYDDVTNIDVSYENASPDFEYDFILDIGVEDKLPSPRFEFDTMWHEGEIIYRWQNMDTRPEGSKLDYTSQTLRDIRIDTNNFDNVRKYILDALRDYVLMSLYDTVGYDKKYFKFKSSYEQNRQYVAYWIKKDSSTQTQYHGYAGV